MKNPIINWLSYLEFRKDDYANAKFGVLYNDLSNVGKDHIDDLVGDEYIKIFNLLYK